MDSTFQESNSDLFDSITHTQGGAPHLMQYLWNKYREYLEEKIEERKEKKLKTLSLAEAVKCAPATGFVQWAAGFLQEHRVVQNFFVDANHGIQLSNNDQVVICPGIEIQGTMQDSGAVAVTEGKSQKGNESVVDINGSLRI